MTMSTGASMQDLLNSYSATYSKAVNTQKSSISKTNQTNQINQTQTTQASQATQVSSEYGNVIGNPELSDTAKEYYEQLKEKYGNYNFVLVSDDQSATAMQHASEYASDDKVTVLIDASRIEAMASDESVREKYEGILDNAKDTLDSLKSSLQSGGADVQSYGIQVNDDGSLSFFAVLRQSTEAQKERIESAREEAREEKKTEEKKEEKEEREERLQNFSASSIDALLQKINDYTQNEKMSTVQTEEEMKVGQHIDFRG